MITSTICPFMKFTLDSICKKLRKKFKNGWSKVLMTMKSAPGNEIVSDFVSNEGVHTNEKNSNNLLKLDFSMF